MASPKTTAPAPGVTGGVTAAKEPVALAGIRTQMRDEPLATLPRPAPSPPDEMPEFDAWLRGHLQRLHSKVLEEPVPERFLNILSGRLGQ